MKTKSYLIATIRRIRLKQTRTLVPCESPIFCYIFYNTEFTMHKGIFDKFIAQKRITKYKSNALISWGSTSLYVFYKTFSIIHFIAKHLF